MLFSTTPLAIMVFLLSTSVTALPSVGAIAEDRIVSTLLKRQEPGTPLYACHLSCGTAVQQGREPNYCTNVPFLINYTACINCAGPNKFNIWIHYGTTLTARGSACGLSTTPV